MVSDVLGLSNRFNGDAGALGRVVLIFGHTCPPFASLMRVGGDSWDLFGIGIAGKDPKWIYLPVIIRLWIQWTIPSNG